MASKEHFWSRTLLQQNVSEHADFRSPTLPVTDIIQRLSAQCIIMLCGYASLFLYTLSTKRAPFSDLFRCFLFVT